MENMWKVAFPLAAIIIFLFPVLGVSGDHGYGLVTIDSYDMREGLTSTNEEDIPLSVIVTNTDPEDAWAIKFRGLLKDPETGEYYRKADGSALIVTIRMTNVGGSSLYNLYPNETKLLELEIETRYFPLGNWSVDIAVEVYELDWYTDVIGTPTFEIIEPNEDDSAVPAVIESESEESNKNSGDLLSALCFIFLLFGSLAYILIRPSQHRQGSLYAENTHDSEVQPPFETPPTETPSGPPSTPPSDTSEYTIYDGPPFPPETDW